jgi:RNA polymerase sigma factor (sigma-70 family)
MSLPYKSCHLSQIRELNSDELNNLVHAYKSGSTELIEIILLQFHPLLLKYTRLLKGDKSPSLINYDTLKLLSLFLPGEEKNHKAAMSVVAYMGSKTSFLEEEEVYHDLILMLMESLKEYEIREGLNSLGYLVTRLRWKIRDWLGQQGSSNLSYLQFDVSNIYRLDSSSRCIPHISHVGNWGTTSVSNEEEWLGHLAPTEDNSYIGLSEMTLEWVRSTEDPLFKELEVYERYLLYLRFTMDMTYEDIAEVLGRDKDTVYRHITSLIKELREMAEFEREAV